MPEVAIVTLTRFTEIFRMLADSLDLYEPDHDQIAVTSGEFQSLDPHWIFVEGVEPFVFARNANIGIARASKSPFNPDIPFVKPDILLVNDDVAFLKPGTIATLQAVAYSYPRIGIVSPQIIGVVGNPMQRFGYSIGHGAESTSRLCFVCVYIKREVLEAVGPLDESFTGYGGDDDDYCDRTMEAGYTLAVTGDAVVKHGYGGKQYSSSFNQVMTGEEQRLSLHKMVAQLQERKRQRAGIKGEQCFVL
jgi:GT2 family glycosyltransferase